MLQTSGGVFEAFLKDVEVSERSMVCCWRHLQNKPRRCAYQTCPMRSRVSDVNSRVCHVQLKVKSRVMCDCRLMPPPKTPSNRVRSRSETKTPLTPSIISGLSNVSLASSPTKKSSKGLKSFDAQSRSRPSSPTKKSSQPVGVIRKGGIESRLDVVTRDYIPPPKQELKRSRSTPATVRINHPFTFIAQLILYPRTATDSSQTAKATPTSQQSPQPSTNSLSPTPPPLQAITPHVSQQPQAYPSTAVSSAITNNPPPPPPPISL